GSAISCTPCPFSHAAWPFPSSTGPCAQPQRTSAVALSTSLSALEIPPISCNETDNDNRSRYYHTGFRTSTCETATSGRDESISNSGLDSSSSYEEFSLEFLLSRKYERALPGA